MKIRLLKTAVRHNIVTCCCFVFIGTTESTVRGWKKDEEKLRSMVQDLEEDTGLKRKRARLAQDTQLDAAVHQWFVQARAEGSPISGPLIQGQATKFNEALNGKETSFVASTGWLHRFKDRHGISQVSIAGEVRSADTEAAQSYPEKLREIIEEGGYTQEQIYNCDETGLCYKMLPNKTLAMKNDPHKHEGFKKIKDRVTLLFCVNKTGSHKVRPLCIGKSQNPRCFYHINRSTLPFSYDASKNAWMTSSIFERWFHKEFVPAVRKHLRQQRLETKALLLLDNCPAHPPAENLVSRCGKIRVSYLPKNTTSKIQPLDQGIISTFKMLYRRELMKKIVNADGPIQDSLKAINVKEMIHLSGQSWDGVKPASIEKCWMKGLGPAFVVPEEATVDNHGANDDSDDDEEEFEGFSAADLEEVQRKLESTPDEIRQWLNIDNDCPTFEHVSDEDIINNVTSAAADDTCIEEEVNDDADEICEPPPKVAEAIQGLETALRWLETQEVDYVKVLHTRNLLDFARSKRETGRKQLKLDQFFVRK